MEYYHSNVCYVCDTKALNRGVILSEAKTRYTKTSVVTKINEVIGDEFMVIVSEYDRLCSRCATLINRVDRLEKDLLECKSIISMLLRTKYKLDENLIEEPKIREEDGWAASVVSPKLPTEADSQNDCTLQADNEQSVNTETPKENCDLSESKAHEDEQFEKCNDLSEKFHDSCVSHISILEGNVDIKHIFSSHEKEEVVQTDDHCSQDIIQVNIKRENTISDYIVDDMFSVQEEITVKESNQTLSNDGDIQDCPDNKIKLKPDARKNTPNKASSNMNLKEKDPLKINGKEGDFIYHPLLSTLTNFRPIFPKLKVRDIGSLQEINSPNDVVALAKEKLTNQTKKKHRKENESYSKHNKNDGKMENTKSQKKKRKKVKKVIARKCSFCPKIFKTLMGLRYHESIHEGKFSYCCDFCGMGFMHRDRLEAHRRKHTKEEPYMCDICGKKFVYAGTYWLHKKWHETPYPYKCSECNKLYKTSSQLAVHRRQHTGERPYKCTYCNSTFTVKNSLDKHIMLHTKLFHYRCDTCNRGFTVRGKYTKHMARAHQVIISTPVFDKKNSRMVIYDDVQEESSEDHAVDGKSDTELSKAIDNLVNSQIVEIIAGTEHTTLTTVPETLE